MLRLVRPTFLLDTLRPSPSKAPSSSLGINHQCLPQPSSHPWPRPAGFYGSLRPRALRCKAPDTQGLHWTPHSSQARTWLTLSTGNWASLSALHELPSDLRESRTGRKRKQDTVCSPSQGSPQCSRITPGFQEE